MIISHSRKFCYWKIARTGSNTAELCIRMSGILDLSQDAVSKCFFFPTAHNLPENMAKLAGHFHPQRAIDSGLLSREQYDEYDHYTMVRDPIERWISAYGYKNRRVSESHTLTPKEFYNSHHSDDPLTINQAQYLSLGGVQIFPFSDYGNSICSIIQACGGDRIEDIPKLGFRARGSFLRRARNEIEGTDLGQKLRSRYADDILLSY